MSKNGPKNPWDTSEKVRETTMRRIYGKGKFWVCNYTLIKLLHLLGVRIAYISWDLAKLPP